MMIHFTPIAAAADNRGSLSIIKRHALAVMYQQGASSRQIFGGWRTGAGRLPSSGVWGSRKAPAGLDAGESTPTRFNLSMNRVATPAKTAKARLASLYIIKKGPVMAKHTRNSTPSVSASLNVIQDRLEQTSALLDMLLNDGGSGQFTSKHDTVLSVIWMALELVEAAQQASQQAFKACVAEYKALIPLAAAPQS